MESSDVLITPGLPGKIPKVAPISINFPNNGAYSYPSISEIRSQLQKDLYDAGSPNFILNPNPNLIDDYANKLDDYSQKAVAVAEAQANQILRIQEKNLEEAQKIDLSAMRALTEDPTPIYKAIDAEGIEKIFVSTSREIDDVVDSIYQKHILTATNAVFDKLKNLADFCGSAGSPIDITQPTIPGLGSFNMSDMLSNPGEIYKTMREQLANKQSAFSQWVSSDNPAYDGSKMDIPAVDAQNQVKAAYAKYIELVTVYMKEKMSLLQSSVNGALGSLELGSVSVAVPTTPELPTKQQAKDYVTGKATPPAPFNEAIKKPSTDVELSQQDIDTKLANFYLYAQNKISELVMGYYAQLFSAIPPAATTIVMPTVTTKINVQQSSASVIGL